jgi:hypothetical protein
MLKYNGDQNIMKMNKTGFLCSRYLPKRSFHETSRWIEEQNKQESCVVIGYHSRIEKWAFKKLLAGEGRIILILSSALHGSLRLDVKKAVKENRLLIISPESSDLIKPAFFSAEVRNKLIVFFSDDLYIAHARRGGLLEKIISGISEKLRTYSSPAQGRLFLHSLN